MFPSGPEVEQVCLQPIIKHWGCTSSSSLTVTRSHFLCLICLGHSTASHRTRQLKETDTNRKFVLPSLCAGDNKSLVLTQKSHFFCYHPKNSTKLNYWLANKVGFQAARSYWKAEAYMSGYSGQNIFSSDDFSRQTWPILLNPFSPPVQAFMGTSFKTY